MCRALDYWPAVAALSPAMARGSQPETQLDRVLLAIGHPTRRAMLAQLRAKKRVSISSLLKLSRVSYNSTWKHILILERAGLIERKPADGRTLPLVLRPGPLDELSDWMNPFQLDEQQPDAVPRASNAGDGHVGALIDSFVSDLAHLVAQSAIDAVREALDQGTAAKPNGTGARASGGGVRRARARKPGRRARPRR